MARHVQPRDERASVLVDGDKFREYGMDEVYTVAVADMHGDTVLITTTDGTKVTFDRDEVIEIDPDEED